MLRLLPNNSTIFSYRSFSTRTRSVLQLNTFQITWCRYFDEASDGVYFVRLLMKCCLGLLQMLICLDAVHAVWRQLVGSYFDIMNSSRALGNHNDELFFFINSNAMLICCKLKWEITWWKEHGAYHREKLVLLSLKGFCEKSNLKKANLLVEINQWRR